MNYDAEETTSTAYIFKLNTPDFNKLNRSKDGKRTDFKQNFLEIIGEKIYVPTNGYCLIKYIEYLTAKDNQQMFLEFIRFKKGRSNFKTKQRFRPFCLADTVNRGYFKG